MDESLDILVYKSSKNINDFQSCRYIEGLGRFSEAYPAKFTEAYIAGLIKESIGLESVFVTDWQDRLVLAINNGIVTACYDDELKHFLNSKYSCGPISEKDNVFQECF